MSEKKQWESDKFNHDKEKRLAQLLEHWQKLKEEEKRLQSVIALDI